MSEPSMSEPIHVGATHVRAYVRAVLFVGAHVRTIHIKAAHVGAIHVRAVLVVGIHVRTIHVETTHVRAIKSGIVKMFFKRRRSSKSRCGEKEKMKEIHFGLVAV